MNEFIELVVVTAYGLFLLWGGIHVLSWLGWLPACLCSV